MGKKDKSVSELAENLHAVTALIHQLENFVKAHKEIAAGYQKYRKNGGEAIPGIEKHLCVKPEKSATSVKKEKAATTVAAGGEPETKNSPKASKGSKVKSAGKKAKKETEM